LTQAKINRDVKFYAELHYRGDINELLYIYASQQKANFRFHMHDKSKNV